VKISETISGPNGSRNGHIRARLQVKRLSEMPIGSMLARMTCTFAVVIGSITAASAQFPDIRSLFSPNPTTGAAPAHPGAAAPAAPAAGAAAPEWSGESGASGHPLMTREAILSAAANFSRCVEGLWPEAARRGVSRASFDQYTAGLTPD